MMSGASAMPGVHWEIRDAFVAFDEHAEEIDSLSADLHPRHPFLTSHFIAPLIRHFAEPGTMLCLARGDAGRLVAMAILVRRQLGVWTTFLPGQAQMAPLLMPAGIDLDDLLSNLPGFSMALEILSQDSAFSLLLAGHQSAAVEKTLHETTMNISLEGTYSGYWDARPKKLRANIGRYFRRLEKDQRNYRFVTITEDADLVAALERYGLLESSGWKGRAQSAIHPDNKQGAFYREVLHNFSQLASARIYELYVDDELAASRIAVAGGSMLVMLKTTYCESLRRYSPGRLLLNLALQHEFSVRNCDVIEFYTDVTRDQLEWATSTREIFHLMHYRNDFFRWLVQRSRPLRAMLGAGRS